ncbi:MAG: TonB-dependent receptor domain-containing protein [Gemmatimonadota bacterium]
MPFHVQRRQLPQGLAVVSLLALSPIAGAQQADQASGQTALAPVVVTATRVERPLLDVPASVDVIERDTLRDAQLRVNLSESLGRVPGVVVLDRQNYAQDLQISVRGFGSRSTFGVRGIRLYVDGIPASFPDGQGQVSHFPLNAAERVEVLRGPFSALYGNSSGGVIALTTELKPQPFRSEVGGAYGSNTTWRAGVDAVGGVEPYAFAIDAVRFSTAGARPHAEARRDTLNLRWASYDSPLGRLRFALNSVSMPNAQDPLGLTRAQFEANPDQTTGVALQFDTRKTTRQTTAGVDLESRLSAQTSLKTAAWIGTRSVEQFQSIPVATQTNPRSPGGVIDFDRNFGGVDLRAVWELDNATATVGIDVERMDENRRGYENFIGTQLGVQGKLRRDEDNRVQSADPYAQLELRWGDAWRINAGVRASHVSFDSKDHYIVGANGDDSGSTSYSAVNPTLGVVFRPTSRASLYVAYGRGFETPTLNELAYRPDGSAGLNTGVKAARSNNFEVGAKVQWTPTLFTTAALFTIGTRDDLVALSNSGGRSGYGNVAKTKRDGAEVAADWRISPRLSAYASAAYIDAKFDADFLTCGPAPCLAPSVPVAAGNKLPAVPARSGFVEIKYRGWADLSAQARAQSALYVDDRNSDRAAGYVVVGLKAARTFTAVGRKVRTFVRVDNVFDHRYAGSVIVNEANGRFFEPAPGRTWLAGLDVTL